MTLNRSQADRAIQNFDNFLNSDSVNSFKSLILESVDKSAYVGIAQRFNDFQSSFSFINTEYKCFNELRETGCLIEPEKITYNFRDEPAAGQSVPIIVDKKNSGSIIPLPATLKKIFELPNVLVETVNYMSLLESTENNEISNIIQTAFWKNKIAGIEEIVLRVFLYEDDFECGNPSGSHATIYKMGGMYLSLPCLSPAFRSKLDNIFLVQIAHAQDIANNPQIVIYNDIINMLNNLSTTGIEIKVEQKNYKLFFKLALIVGDNLGLNRILGFKTHFNSDFFCKFCKATVKETNKLTTQDDSLLRDLNSYERHTKEKLIPQQSGIMQNCVWNNVMDFHVATNFSIDIMHDLFEGVCRYNFGYMLPYILNQHFLSHETLNFRIKYFNYGQDCNKPVPITQSHLKNKYVVMSASEMKRFVLSACLIFGDLIPIGDPFWELYILMRRITILCLKSIISQNDNHELKELIRKHHALFLKLTGTTLKAKYHNLLHYPLVASIVGPLSQLSTIRFEAKHRPLKQGAQTSSNKINLPYTIALKNQLHSSQIFLDNIGFKNEFEYAEFSPNFKNPIITVKDDVLDHFYQIKSFNFEKYTYKIGTVVKISSEEFPKYGKIANVFRKKSNTCSSTEKSNFAFSVQIFSSIAADYHLQSFELQEKGVYQFCSFQSLPFLKPRNLVFMKNGKYYTSFDNNMD